MDWSYREIADKHYNYTRERLQMGWLLCAGDPLTHSDWLYWVTCRPRPFLPVYLVKHRTFKGIVSGGGDASRCCLPIFGLDRAGPVGTSSASDLKGRGTHGFGAEAPGDDR